MAREVGSGRPSSAGRAVVPGVAGTWKDLTDNVNAMALEDLDDAGAQHRRGDDLPSRGDSCRKISVDVRGEILELKNTINVMVDQLGSFAVRNLHA